VNGKNWQVFDTFHNRNYQAIVSYPEKNSQNNHEYEQAHPLLGSPSRVEVSLLQSILADATVDSCRGLAGQECHLKTFEITTGVKGAHPLGCFRGHQTAKSRRYKASSLHRRTLWVLLLPHGPVGPFELPLWGPTAGRSQKNAYAFFEENINPPHNTKKTKHPMRLYLVAFLCEINSGYHNSKAMVIKISGFFPGYQWVNFSLLLHRNDYAFYQ
jgi:hypothetical protein